MSATRDLEQVLRSHLDHIADHTVRDGELDLILDQVARRPQRPGWLASLRNPTMTAQTLVQPRFAPLAAVMLLVIAGLLLLGMLAAIAGGRHSATPPVNGRIVFGRFDPAQGDTVPYTVNPDGSHLALLRPQAAEDPFWSPDGKRISTTDMILNADGSGAHPLRLDMSYVTFGCGNWSPDGRRWLCQGWNDDHPDRGGLFTVRASDGGDLTRLTTGPDGIGHFSPDGSMIAFVRGLPDVESGYLYVADADGRHERRLTSLVVSSVRWAPDGRSLLVSSAAGIYGIDVVTANVTQYRIASDPSAKLFGPLWSPDGTTILFEWNGDLYTMLPDGTHLVRVTSDPAKEYFADWGTHPLQ